MAQELIIFVGLQGSGKTTFYRGHFAATPVHVGEDLMRSVRRKDERQEMLELIPPPVPAEGFDEIRIVPPAGVP